MPEDTTLGRAVMSSSIAPIRTECNISIANDGELLVEAETRLAISRLTKLWVRGNLSAMAELSYVDWDIRHDMPLRDKL